MTQFLYFSRLRRFGRKKVIVGSAFVLSAINVLSAFAPHVAVFLVARFVMGMADTAFFSSCLVLNTELVRKDQRKIPRTVLSVVVGLVCIGLLCINAVVSDHRYFQTLLATYMFVSGTISW